MTEPQQPGNKNLPDFDQLNDRVIAEGAPKPIVVIKTNLDPQDSTVDNPYYQNKEKTDEKVFREYFED